MTIYLHFDLLLFSAASASNKVGFSPMVVLAYDSDEQVPILVFCKFTTFVSIYASLSLSLFSTYLPTLLTA